ncbi:MAG: ATP-binding protein, partial [Lachnospiraceae bacterium]|nr:ATP-binding protein [Lachnospiraceae bacterium]
IVTATAAGPAFEGGAGAGVIGSDMIACAASLLKRGILDETGLLAEPYFTEGVTVGEPAVRLCNKDIRDLQMAKAAVRAGIEILRRQMGETQIGHIYLAGGFGYYLDVEAAFSIGLLPERMRGRVTAVGNTSLAGAFKLGCDLWRGKTNPAALEHSLSSIVSINLAEREEFERLYVRYMNFSNE